MDATRRELDTALFMLKGVLVLKLAQIIMCFVP